MTILFRKQTKRPNTIYNLTLQQSITTIMSIFSTSTASRYNKKKLIVLNPF